MVTTQTVMKYKLEPNSDSVASADMPIGSKILTAEISEEVLCIWAQVMPGIEKVTRRFMLFGTGMPLGEKPGTYIATIFGTTIEGHLYEIG